MNEQAPFQDPSREHPFAAYVRILGKGKTGTRSLTQEEAGEAFGMILRGETEPLQLGAFLMLLRVKEETGEELAGFASACRQAMNQPPPELQADLDWSSYAGKKHQHPWFLLAALLLAQSGYRVFIHGADGHTPGRLYTEQAMLQLGLPVAGNWDEVDEQLDRDGLSYLPLRHFCPPLHEMMQLRPLLGLRSPVNTLARLINPLQAACSIQSVFHPAYCELHQRADLYLEQPRSVVFKGDSGEAEIKPQADTRLKLLVDGQIGEQLLPRSIQGRVNPVDLPAVAPLRDLWRGEAEDGYGLDSVLATVAATLLILQPGQDIDAARERASALWRQRDQSSLS